MFVVYGAVALLVLLLLITPLIWLFGGPTVRQKLDDFWRNIFGVVEDDAPDPLREAWLRSKQANREQDIFVKRY